MANRWGGAREGAGRPRVHDVELTTDEKLRRQGVMAALMNLGPASHNHPVRDDDLREDWDGWARDEGPWFSNNEWPEESYAHLRFELGLSVDDAIEQHARCIEREFGLRSRYCPAAVAWFERHTSSN